MLALVEQGARLCDRVARREFLRAGMLGMLGAAGGPRSTATALGDALGSDAQRARQVPAARAKRCIVLFLLGGPPQHSTWDPKPAAPAEIRGEFGPISTAVPGIQICELLPATAKLMQHIAIVRAMSTGDDAHSSSGYAMLTGHPHQPLNFENANPGPPNDWPTLGAVIQHLQAGPPSMPPAMRLPMHIFNTDQSVWPGQDSGFLGSAADPWLFRCEPASANFKVPEYQVSGDMTLARLDGRKGLLRQLDARLAALETSGALMAFDDKHRQAFDLLSSTQSKHAFDLAREPQSVRDRYGRHQFGQSTLLARRLVEAGVTFVQVNWFRGADEPADAPCWDSHTQETSRLKQTLCPSFDQAYSALLSDLSQRGLLEDTLVVCMGEFGRTPKMNSRGGRDHWGHVFSVTLAGGGIQGGAVHGASDRHGAYAQAGLVRPQDLAATLFHCLGYPAQTEIQDRLGRPLPISQGRVIREILA